MGRFRALRTAWSAAAFLNRATSASQTGVQGFEPCGAALETAARLMLLTTRPAASPRLTPLTTGPTASTGLTPGSRRPHSLDRLTLLTPAARRRPADAMTNRVLALSAEVACIDVTVRPCRE